MSPTPQAITVDFETFGIEDRPAYPPKPVGVSIQLPGSTPKYYAWGHATKNNCEKSDVAPLLEKIWNSKDHLAFQNGKFDIDVANVHFKLKDPSWDRIEDTMFLLFLHDPNQTELGLKPSAHRILGMPPEEQDAVADWLIEHQPVQGVKISRAKNSDHYFGRYIAYAPGDLVGKYANGDTLRTSKLFRKLYPDIVKRGMLEAYEREKKLMPILLEMERQGVPVDMKSLKRDVAMYQRTQQQIDTWIIRRLRASKDLNIDSSEQLIDAMIAAKCADPTLLPLTPKTGKYQATKEALLMGVTDKVMLAVLKYRAQLKTCMGTFMEPWLETALQSNGLIFTTWNQVKNPKGRGNVGARTGRLSSSPNFQNIPKEFQPIFWHEAKLIEELKQAWKNYAKAPFELPSLPKVRSYITAFEDEVLIGRDYSQQELRILAHFDGGDLLDKYNDDPWMDVHDYAREELARGGLFYSRKQVKTTNFGLIYGMGVTALAEDVGLPYNDTKFLKKSVLGLYPGLSAMNKDMKVRAANNEPIRTWGGREYYCEEPKIIKGRIQTFEYKMVNTLIQGSAADCTKESMIRFHAAKDKKCRMLLSVHDEQEASSRKSRFKKDMEDLREAMESVKFDLPMLSEGMVSSKNWGCMKPYDVKGKVVYVR
jgi:DNA polymerase I-like protein with 3'-5' exonuclease and polymerase domains